MFACKLTNARRRLTTDVAIFPWFVFLIFGFTFIIMTLYIIQIAHNPPLLIVSFSLTKGKPKDSRKNILDTKEFTVNIISEPFIEAANATSVSAPPHIDEWVVAGLTPGPSVSVIEYRGQSHRVTTNRT